MIPKNTSKKVKCDKEGKAVETGCVIKKFPLWIYLERNSSVEVWEPI